MDCPIGEKDTKNLNSMWVAVHNPSSVDMQSMQVSIPSELNFKASVFNKASNKMEPTSAEKVCYDDHLDSDKPITNCRLEVKAQTEAQAISLVQLDVSQNENSSPKA